MTKFLISIFLLVLPFIMNAQDSCSIINNSNLAYLDPDNETVYVVIDGDDHIEYHNNGEFYIRSKMKWINDCEYENTMKKVTIPNFPYKKGAVMHVKIEIIEDGMIYCVSNVGDGYWKTKFFILDELPKEVKQL